MTPWEMDAAIAQHLGWKNVHVYEDDAGPPIHCGTPPGPASRSTKIPRYSEDLNAMHEAVSKLTNLELFRYADEVCDLAYDGGHDADIQMILKMEAKELAECYVRAIGKWRVA